MNSVGDTLRRERIQRKLDLDQISNELKISRRMLDAIESDQYERLPGGVFARAFVRQYAGLLGLDGEELAERVQRSIEPAPLVAPGKARPALAPIDVPRVEEWNSVGDKRFRLSGSLPAAALVVVVMLICSAVYAWMQRPRTVAPAPSHTSPLIAQTTAPPAVQPVAPPSTPAPQPANADATPTASEPASAPPTPVTDVSSQPAASVPASQPSQPAPAAPTAPGAVHVEIVADEPLWLSARADGKYVFSDTMQPNTRRAVDGDKEVVLRLGNAGAANISLNGNPIGSAGPKGQVRTLQFTSGGFQIVLAKPAAPAVPLDPLDR